MKKALLLLAALIPLAFPTASPVRAGTVDEKEPAVAPATAFPWFRDHEWSLLAFGTYATSPGHFLETIGDHAWGGGLEGRYFLTRYLGLGLEAEGLQSSPRDDGSAFVGANLYLRLPIEAWRLAPYFTVGLGGFFTGRDDEDGFRRRGHSVDDDLFGGQAGGGLEYRMTRRVGLFFEGSYLFFEENRRTDFPQVRSGVTFTF